MVGRQGEAVGPEGLYGPGGGGNTSSRRKVTVGRNGLRVLAPTWVPR